MNNVSLNFKGKKPEIIKDYIFAFKLYKRNFLPFFIVLLVGSILYFSLEFLFCDYIFPRILPYNFVPANILYGLVRLPRDFVLYGFFGVAIGLGYEIMSSGDQFTEVRRSWYYIKKYWLKFATLSLILNWLGYFTVFILNGQLNIEVKLLLRFFSFFWFISISEAYAAVINRKKIIKALDDNFKILKRNFTRIFMVFSLYYIVFLLPRSIFGLYLGYWVPVGSELHQSIGLIMKILTGVYILVGFPIFSFISIGIYNSELWFKDRTNEHNSKF